MPSESDDPTHLLVAVVAIQIEARRMLVGVEGDHFRCRRRISLRAASIGGSAGADEGARILHQHLVLHLICAQIGDERSQRCGRDEKVGARVDAGGGAPDVDLALARAAEVRIDGAQGVVLTRTSRRDREEFVAAIGKSLLQKLATF